MVKLDRVASLEEDGQLGQAAEDQGGKGGWYEWQEPEEFVSSFCAFLLYLQNL